MTDLAPLTEAERKELAEQIDQRRKELQEKRRLLQSLTNGRGGLGSAGQVATAGSASALLGKVMAAVSEANAAALAETPAPSTAAPAKAPAVASNVRYSKALKRVVGALQEVTGAVDVSIAPALLESFDKSCQCDLLPPEIEPPAKDETPAIAPPTGDTKLAEPSSQTTVVTVATQVFKPVVPHVLSEEETKRLLFDPRFDAFFDDASRTVERELGGAEFFGSYAAAVAAGAEGAEGGVGVEQVLTLGEFTDSLWSSGRPIVDATVHPKFPEVILASYGAKEHVGAAEPEGCALIWNLAMHNRPEYALTSQSPVTAAIFEPYRAHTVLGGTFTGRIALWDTRAKTTRPQQRTPLSQKGHRHPIYCMSMVGTENAHSLVSLDGDGRLCVWSLAMLSQPTESLDFKSRGREVRPACCSFCPTDQNKHVIGCDDGNLYQAHIHGSQAGISDIFAGHRSPVTDVHWHPKIEGADNSSYLILSSSFDWTVRLWSAKGSRTAALLHTFDVFEDYAASAQWHPRNPSVFAAGQVSGVARIWDLSKGFDIPATTATVTDAALTKLRWSADGQRLIVGDSKGKLTMWGVSQEISLPKPESVSKWETIVGELKPGRNGTSA